MTCVRTSSGTRACPSGALSAGEVAAYSCGWRSPPGRSSPLFVAVGAVMTRRAGGGRPACGAWYPRPLVGPRSEQDVFAFGITAWSAAPGLILHPVAPPRVLLLPRGCRPSGDCSRGLVSPSRFARPRQSWFGPVGPSGAYLLPVGRPCRRSPRVGFRRRPWPRPVSVLGFRCRAAGGPGSVRGAAAAPRADRPGWGKGSRAGSHPRRCAA